MKPCPGFHFLFLIVSLVYGERSAVLSSGILGLPVSLSLDWAWGKEIILRKMALSSTDSLERRCKFELRKWKLGRCQCQEWPQETGQSFEKLSLSAMTASWFSLISKNCHYTQLYLVCTYWSDNCGSVPCFSQINAESNTVRSSKFDCLSGLPSGCKSGFANRIEPWNYNSINNSCSQSWSTFDTEIKSILIKGVIQVFQELVSDRGSMIAPITIEITARTAFVICGPH